MMKIACKAALATALASMACVAAGQAAPPAAPAAETKRPRVGLVLSGGGARGLAHLGVLKVLQEMRVPVDCVAGTSMGALVGGTYSAGVSTERMVEYLSAVDWNSILTDAAPRQQVPFRIKGDDLLNLFAIQLGFRDGSVILPTGIASGYKLELFLRVMLERAGNFRDQDFDRLPLPFRAVATNLENGKPHVFDRGDLVLALRASMSVPGAFAPKEIGGELFVDGGLVDNLPIEVARKTCADRVIAVNLGSPLLKRDQLNNIFGVGLQTINLLTEQNVRASIASLRPGDILIEPALGDFSAANFQEALATTVPIGEAAARALAPQLAELAVAPEEYAQWRQGILARLPDVPRVTGVAATTSPKPSWVNPEVIKVELENVPGIDLRQRKETDFDPVNLARRLVEVYGRGDFESIGYSMNDLPSGRIALVDGLQKSWGPNYLRFGLALSRDDYQSTFDAALQYRATWLNSTGTEWRSFAQIGHNTVASTEIFQPLGFREGVFIQPRLAYELQPKLFFDDGLFIGQYNVKTLNAELNAGIQNRFGELRAGVFGGKLNASSQFGIASTPLLGPLAVPSYEFNQAGYTARAVYDQLDSVHFPSKGVLLSVRSFGTFTENGSIEPYNRTEATATLVQSFGPHALQLTAYGGATLYGQLPPYDPLELGGLLRGSGYNFQELFGDNLYMARTVYTYQYASLPPQLGRGVYFGGSLEVTRARDGFGPNGAAAFRPSASVFVGVDTLLGPLYLGWGQVFSPISRGMWYLLLGTR